MATSRAAVLDGVRHMALKDLELPEIGPDDALLRVELAGVCGTDAKIYTGKLDAPLPMVLGHEILGHIEAVGETAAARYGVSEGDRVLVEGSIPCWACGSCLSGRYRFCRSQRGYGTKMALAQPPGLWGAMAEYMYMAPGSILHRIPADISPRVAILAGPIANGIQWLRTHGGLSIGQDVVIQGVGPQGLAAIPVARECGARTVTVTGLSSDGARLALARELGADATIVADTDDVVEQVRDLTDGRLADLVLDVTGSPAAIRASTDLVREAGTLVLAGLTGKDVLTPLAIDVLVWREIRVQGVYIKGADAVEAGIRFLGSKLDRYAALERVVSHVYDLADAEAAIQAAGGAGADDFVKAAIAP
jgi:alcohol dehydrogenase